MKQFKSFHIRFDSGRIFLEYSLIACIFFFIGCSPESEKSSDLLHSNTTPNNTLFHSISAETSGVSFINRINETATENYFSYNYFYNGAGVGIGDLNNDNLPDLYFAGNQVTNKLYLNKGDFQFEDITSQSNAGAEGVWSTGVTMVDINCDGWLDIYVCVAGKPENSDSRKNKLFINQKNNTFIEQADQFGLDDEGYSTQAYFFDFDRDNDLDVYIVNHRIDFQNNSRVDSRIARDIQKETSDQLYENINGKFVNISQKAGIQNKSWGLSASIADFNRDGWPDIYIANDFLEPDLLYINQQNGTFREECKNYFDHISFYGMGSDVGDINNDGLPDLYVLDMVSEDHVRSKRNMASMSNDNFWNLVNVGYHYQYMLNTLQLNNGNNSFSEIAQMAGVNQTDWSWAPLIADFDQDGYQDIFVTNGIKRDVTDNDFKIKAKAVVDKGETLTAQRALEMMTSTKTKNYAFKNNGDLTFSKKQNNWGLDDPLNSNGAIYSDLDGDGDLDLVLNNIDAFASIYQNGSNDKNHFRIKVQGPENNPNGIGAEVILKCEEGSITHYNYSNRGFMSSRSGDIVMSYGNLNVNEVTIQWSDGKSQTIVPDSKNIVFSYSDATQSPSVSNPLPMFTEVSENFGISFEAYEDEYDDFNDEILLPHRQSRMGPASIVADFNSDGLDDILFGGAFGVERKLFIQEANNQFSMATQLPEGENKEDVDVAVFDLEGDGDLDIYFACGGNSFSSPSINYSDELLINDGKGNFSSGSISNIPATVTSCVRSSDIDLDGDIDLFVAGGSKPKAYPMSETSYWLVNENGKFKQTAFDQHDVSDGIIRCVELKDMNGDSRSDLIYSGEWMPVFICYNMQNGWSKPDRITEYAGWHFSLSVHDFNQDGKEDIIAGNLGLNNKFHPKKDYPLHLYFADFDENGKKDIVLSKDKGEYKLPVRGRECSSQQMPFILDKFPTYQEFAEADLKTIYGDKLESALHLQVENFAHHLLTQNNDGGFDVSPLPNSMQRSPIMDIKPIQLKNGSTYFVFGGNFHPAEVETVRYDGGIGGLFQYKNDQFIELPASNTGLYLEGDVRQVHTLKLANDDNVIIAVRNLDEIKTFLEK